MNIIEKIASAVLEDFPIVKIARYTFAKNGY